MKKFLLVIALAFSLSPLFSFVNESNIEVEVGGRFDQVRFDFAATGLTATYHFDDIASWDIGLRGRWALDPCWYVRGNVDYGVITSAETRINSVESPSLLQTGGAKGHLLDVSAALGRFFCITRSIAIAPVFGWGYDGQYLWTKAMGSKYTVKEIESGAFLGVDVHTEWFKRCFVLNFGYEVHFASSRAKVQFQPTTSLSEIRGHSKVTYGQVGWLEALYRFSRCWHVGLRGEVVSYSTTKPGTVTPNAQSPTYGLAHCNEISWQSAQLSLLLGYVF